MERIDNSKSNFAEQQRYIVAKKKVEKIKGFYIHLVVYIIVNIFISSIIIYGLTSDSDGEYDPDPQNLRHLPFGTLHA